LLALYAAGPSQASAKDETVKNFLTKCEKDNRECSEEVLNYLALGSLQGMHLCWKGTPVDKLFEKSPSDYSIAAPVRPWFKAHPEMLSMELTAGLLKAFEALYACR